MSKDSFKTRLKIAKNKINKNSNSSNLVSENKSSLPNENMSQDPSDLDDEIPF